MSEGMFPASRRCYCLDCEWSISTEDHSTSRRGFNTSIIEHAVERGHDIESETITDVDRESEEKSDYSPADIGAGGSNPQNASTDD